MTAGDRGRAGALALASAAAFVALYAVATGTRLGRDVDEDILNDALEGKALGHLALALVHVVSPITAAAAFAAILWFAVVRRGRCSALAVAVALVAANASAALLKLFTGEVDPLGGESARDLGVGFYPSGHATAVMSITLAAIVLVGPSRTRPRAALIGGMAAGALGVAMVVAITHHASDIVGGFLLATTWVAGTWAIVSAPERSEDRRSLGPVLAAALLSVMLGALGAVVAGALDWPAAPVAGAGAVLAIALALAAVVAALGAPRE